MTQDEIIEMARQAGINTDWEISAYKNELQHFAKLVAEREREACALIADKEVDFWLKTNAEKEDYLEQALFIAKEIRARGQA